jgi:hypothetical protein
LIISSYINKIQLIVLGGSINGYSNKQRIKDSYILAEKKQIEHQIAVGKLPAILFYQRKGH